MLAFRRDEEPRRNHAIQIWRTPYAGPDVIQDSIPDSFLGKIGNVGVVSCLTDCHALLSLIDKEDSYANLYLDLTRISTDILDSYFWLGDEQAFNLRAPVEEIKKSAKAAIDEFEKVSQIRKATQQELDRLKSKTAALIKEVELANLVTIDQFVELLTGLRTLRGEIISRRELRYVDAPLLETLEKDVTTSLDTLSARCVEFLLKPESLAPYSARIEERKAALATVAKSAAADDLDASLAKDSAALDMLIEVVGNLKIKDPTETTRIIDGISAVYAAVNQTKSALKNKRKELFAVEGAAQFASQIKLLSQSVTNYLDLCDSVKRCDEFLTKVMVQIEELEARFAEVDDYVAELTLKREEIYNAFDSRRTQLNESKNKRCASLQSSR